MTTRQPASRLEMMQARFQQKQLQEKEQKLLQLYDQQQQRAYQVVQRGSAGSNASNASNGSTGSNVNQQTVSRMSTTTYATSHAQGGKVRQMFDERRQTTKGIDRSYPLEPLDDKLTKQWSSSDFKNGNQSKNRQFVDVRRTVTRGDVNSNVNGGKPHVSYYEEVSHTESHDNQRRNTGEREKGSYTVNRHEFRTSMKNGNRKDDEEEQLEETLDNEAIERNRMMAKIHLMDFDESMKHRVRNDLESEQFPEDLMIDVPDKLPKKNPTKKLTQAEARLARFKQTNAKKDNLSKNPTSTATRKIKEQTLPVRSTVRKQRYATGENVERPKRHGDYEAQTSRSRIQRSTSPEFFRKELEKGAATFDVKSRSSPEIALQPPSRHVFQRKKTSETARYSETIHARQRQRTATPEFFCRESETSATTYSLKPRPKSTELSSSHDIRKKNKSKTDFNRQENVVDSQLKMNYRISDKIRSPSPEFFCRESETSATTYSLKPRPKSTELSSPGDVHKKNKSKTDFNRQENVVDSQLKMNYRISDKIRSPSPEFFCRESETSATTYSLKPRPKSTELSSSRDIPKKNKSKIDFNRQENVVDSQLKMNYRISDKIRSPSPEFFCKESETSATTYSLKPRSKSTELSSSRDIHKKNKSKIDFNRQENVVDSQLKMNYRISDKIRSPSPEFFCKESETSATTYSLKPRPKNSGTKITDLSDAHTVSSKMHRFDADDSEFTYKSKTTEIGTKQTSEYFRNEPSSEPEFYCKESKTLATTFSLKPKPVGPVSQTRQENAFQKRSASIDFSAEETRDSSMEQAQSSTVKLSQKYTDAAKIIDTSDSEKESQDRRSRRAETHHGYFDETESSILKRKKRDVERSNRVRNIYKTRAHHLKNRNLKDKKPTRISSGALKSVNVLRGIMKNGGKEDCPPYAEAPISTGGKSSFSAESSARNKGRSIFQKYQITCSLRRSPSVKQLRSIEDIRKSIRRISDVHLVSPSAVITLSRQLQPKFVITSNKRKECSAVKEEKQRRVVGKEVSNCEFLKDIRNVRSGKPGNGIFDGKFNHCRTTKSPSPDSPEKKSGETSVRSTVRRTTTILTNSPSRNTAILSRDSKTPSKETTTKGSEVRANEISASTINKSLDLVDNEESRGNYSAAENKGKTVDESEQSPTNAHNERTEFKENNLEISRKSPAKKQQTSERSSSRPNSSTSSASSPSSMHASSVRDRMTTKVKTGSRSPKIPSAPSKIAKSAGNIGNIADNLVACKVCRRRFAHERIVLHEQICSKAAQKKRKQFDAMMFRVKGTDLEPFVKKGTPKKQTEAKTKKPEVKSNWRRKHEDFINAIRSAKQVQAHLAAGGKLSDLPPPPVSDTSDYIQCPHCGRKFNEAAAQRHIPKCENMLHNKPSNARAPFRSKR